MTTIAFKCARGIYKTVKFNVALNDTASSIRKRIRKLENKYSAEYGSYVYADLADVNAVRDEMQIKALKLQRNAK